MTNWYEQAKAYSIESIAAALNLQKKGTRWSPCPACGSQNLKDISKTDKRYPLRFYTSGNTDMFECRVCKVYGNSFDLVSWVKEGRPAEETLTTYYDKKAKVDRNDWSILRNHFMDMNIVSFVEKHGDNYERQRQLQYPPITEVEALLKTSTWIPKCESKRVISWCNRRGIDYQKMKAGLVNTDFDCSALTHIEYNGREIPWWPSNWKKTFPVLIPLVDTNGNLKSVMGRATNKEKRKTTCPIGHSTKGLLFANINARNFMKRNGNRPEKVWICEGEMDYLTVAQFDQMTVIGVREGSTFALRNLPWHPCQTVFVATDNDAKGDEFANQIAKVIYPAIGRRIDVRNLGGIT